MGGHELVRATRLLLSTALCDPEVTHIALLSESCVPIRSLSYILASLEASPKSRFYFSGLDYCSLMQRARAKAVPSVPDSCWRFQPQWWLMSRETALWANANDYTKDLELVEIPDEMYFSTVLMLQGYPLEDRVHCRPVTWTFWEKGHGSPKIFKDLDAGIIENMWESGCFFARKFARGADMSNFRLHRQ
ncbi:beta-1,6-N-acetylglucosaminyltransferase [Luteolibacter sp. GHJ8]|uniref:Beta-1,6-N-acetylglucosaminyltransferase n=1 Tax=Luteolibacter rhizosphaerae TaxID=2989719 RepID=A0ABT3G376_9BACT|nr:beta-1,6-N-acetylglucosaminyltransferase [Luteolibacter rhizosphaerae]MCW1914291.1 beta-1,6-N-acetylglucosaminyltransferase [Luteolibacter rhizosphaerae]